MPACLDHACPASVVACCTMHTHNLCYQRSVMIFIALRQTTVHMETVDVVIELLSPQPCSSGLHRVSTTQCLVSLLESTAVTVCELVVQLMGSLMMW